MNLPARHLLHVVPSFGIGGVPVRITRLVNHFGNRFRHTILALDEVVSARELLRGDLAVEVLPYAVDKKRPLGELRRYRRMLAARKPDLLVTYNWGAIDWAMANRFLQICPHIHQEDGFGIEEAQGQLRRRVLYRRIALGSSRMVIVPSRTLAEIAQAIWRIEDRKLRYLPNGVDIARFANAMPAAHLGGRAKPGDLVIGTVAPLRPEKTLERLIRAFAGIASDVPARLVIAGDGSERPRLESLAAELGLAARVTFLGNVNAPETVLKLFDVFAISSDTEQMPTTVLEAMAAGLPIAGVDVGDVKAMVAEENKPFIVAKGDERALGEAVSSLLGCPGTRRRLAEANAREAATRFSQDEMFASYEEIYSS
jgi:glycosyltransferase involved in cell wall biosynthesis